MDGGIQSGVSLWYISFCLKEHTSDKSFYFQIGVLFTLLFLFYCPESQAERLDIRLPITSQHQDRDNYQIGLLKLALSKAGLKYNIQFNKREWTQTRIISELAKENIDLYWMGTSIELEEKLRPVRIPIYRGLLGHRVFIINKQEQDKFSRVFSTKDLEVMLAAQGRGWSDVEILNSAGLRTYTQSYENIFKLVNAKRVDYFPRGINEAFGEVKARRDKLPNLVVEKNILLVYPFAKFFFTSKNNLSLSKKLEEGLNLAYADGSFLEYFSFHPKIQSVFREANLEGRVRLDIDNPMLSNETKSIPKKYWHQL